MRRELDTMKSLKALLAAPRNGALPETPVYLHQWPDEFSALLAIYRALRPKTVLEVGTADGGTLYHFIQDAPVDARILSVDDGSMGRSPAADVFRSWADDACVELTLSTAPSVSDHSVGLAAELAPFEFVFIDADHSYEAVSRDWETYRPMVAPGGLVAFHDILPADAGHPHIQVERLWREIQSEGFLTRELVADRDAGWGGIGIVYLP